MAAPRPAFVLPSNVALRKTGGISHDASAPRTATGFAETTAEFSSYQSSVLDICMEKYINIPAVAAHSFETELLPVSPVDAQLFVDSFLEYESFCETPGADPTVFSPGAALQERLRASRIEERLQEVVERVRGGGALVFVKTSSRSPKDAPASQSRLAELFRARIAASHPGGGATENEKLEALLVAGKGMLAVPSAAAALALLCRSRRTYQDFTLALAHPDRWEQNLVVRRWEDSLDVASEFRCFVKGGAMTAISQYHHLCCFQRLLDACADIPARLAAFFEANLRAPLAAAGFTDYVLDLGILRAGRVVLIELNPFLETTDACCFEWRGDAAVLEGRSGAPGGVVFRARDKPLAGAKSFLYDDWRLVFDSC